MEYVQERIATLHDLTGSTPSAPVDRATVVVPMTEREFGGLAAERVLSELEAVDPDRVVVPLRSPADRVGPFRDWLDDFELDATLLWCDGPRVADLLSAHGLNGDRGKGRDLWLGLGQALDAEYVAVHDADTKSYDRSYVPRLLFPLSRGYDFSKGYYARVEDGRLYGRLFRLFYAPLVRALADAHDAPALEYLRSFRYALAGEFAATRDVVRSLRPPRAWGFEVGTLGDAFEAVGFEGTAQVDLGRYEHDHRAVSGPTGLGDMSESVGAALFDVAEANGVDLDYDALTDRYLEVAERLVRAYETDAAYNDLAYDPDAEREQIRRYADAVTGSASVRRLPAWSASPISPDEVLSAAADDADDADDAVE